MNESDASYKMHRTIAAALMEFELATGKRVSHISLEHIATQKIHEPAEFIRRYVRVHLEPVPPIIEDDIGT